MAGEEESRGQKDANDIGCLCSIHLIKVVLLGKCILQLGLLQVFTLNHTDFGVINEYFMLLQHF